MKIIIGKTAGFCFGVQKAVDGANFVVDNSCKSNNYCLGEIVHNKNVVTSLESRGLITAKSINEVEDEVIIRAHGVASSIYDHCLKNDIKMHDFTCHHVLSIHKLASKYVKENYYVILLGDSNHPENIGTISRLGEYYSVINSINDVSLVIDKVIVSDLNKVLLISQSTFDYNKYMEISNEFSNYLPDHIDYKTVNTVCSATKKREDETRELSKTSDLMIIVGGKNSSNTKKLYNIAKLECKSAILIEDASELILPIKENIVSIMGGASTPHGDLVNVKKVLENQKII